MRECAEKLDQYLGDLFKKRGYPGMAVCIRGPEGILFDRGYGYRNMEKKLEVNGDTIFGIASMSKSMTALACCILETEGKMSLDDPVVKYFPDFHIPGAADECVTVKMLAMHRAGIPPMEPLEWSIAKNSKERDSHWYREMLRTSPNQMDRIEHIIDYISAGNYEPLGAPGEYMSYSNEGYAIMSYIVDQAAGIPLEQFLKERIFEPLGMTRTVLDLDGSEAAAFSEGNMTSLFERDEDGNLVWDDNWSILPPFRGCACVKSTSHDMTRYYQMLSNMGVWEGKQVIKRAAVERMYGSEYPLQKKTFYCLGLEKNLIAGTLMCEHSGGLHGVSTQGGFLEGGYSVTVLCNEGDLGMNEFQWACYNWILGLPLDEMHYWAVPSENQFSHPEMLTGDFLAKEGLPAHCVVSLEDGKLTGVFNDKKMLLLYSRESTCVGVDAENPAKRINTFEFFIRNGSAWAVKCGSRIYQRISQGEKV